MCWNWFNSWLFPFSLDVKGEKKHHPEPRQRGNATSPHPFLSGSCKVNKPSIQRHSDWLCSMQWMEDLTLPGLLMHNNRKISAGAPNTSRPNCNLFFSCAFGPMSMSFWHLQWIYLYKIVLSFHIGHYQTFDLWPTGHGFLGNLDRILAQPC